MNATKTRFGEDEAVEMAEQASQIYVCKGKKVVHLNVKKDKPDRETLAKLLLGPTGNLRAPTFRMGKTLLVGFNEETYRDLMG